MAETTGIQWTDRTWNPWLGCTKVSPGCTNCYAETLDKRWGRDFSIVRRSSPTTFNAPLRWARQGFTGFVFTCSMSDFFHQRADLWRDEAWEIMQATPKTIYQVLTKRPGLAVGWYKHHGWLPNVWLGTSVESAKYLPRLDVMARVPAPVRFVSAEPLLGPVDLRRWLEPGAFSRCSECGRLYLAGTNGPKLCPVCKGFPTYEKPRALSWIIVGGESGPKARPFDLAWARSIVAQCKAEGVPFFMKQIGAVPFQKEADGLGAFGDRAWNQLAAVRAYLMRDSKGGDPSEWPADLRVREMPVVLP